MFFRTRVWCGDSGLSSVRANSITSTRQSLRSTHRLAFASRRKGLCVVATGGGHASARVASWPGVVAVSASGLSKSSDFQQSFHGN